MRNGTGRRESPIVDQDDSIDYYISMKQFTTVPRYDAVCDAFRKYGVSYAGLFGSRAFGDQKPESDYDIVIEFFPDSKTTLLGMIELKQRLEDLFGTDVDLVTKQSISPYLRDSILSSVTPIYEQKN